MRWAYVIPRVVIVGLVWLFFRFGFDPLLMRGVIYSGQRAARAKVEMAGLSSKFFSPYLESSRVAVADRKHPGTNLVELSNLTAKVETKALLKKSLIVEQATVSGLKWGTPRSDDGLLPGDLPDRSANSDSQILDAMQQRLLAGGKDWLAGLADRAQLEFDPQQLETVRLGQELEVRWPREFGDYEQQIAELKARIGDLKRQVKLKGGNELEKAERYARAAQEAERLLQEMEPLRERLNASVQQAQDDMQAMNEAKDRDLQKLRDKVDSLKLNPEQITEFLLGPELNQRLQTALSWTGFLRERLRLATDEPKPERSRGIDFVFKRREELPRFLIRLMNLDGEGVIGGDRLAFRGTASGITSDPKRYGKPIIIRLEGTGLESLALKEVSAIEPHPSADTTGGSIQQTAASSATLSPGDVEQALSETTPGGLVSNPTAKGKPTAAQTPRVQLKAVLDFTQELPKHQVLISYKDPRAEERMLGNGEAISFAVNSRATNCLADLKLIGDDLAGQIDFHQLVSAITAQFGRKRFKYDDRVLKVVQDSAQGIDNLDAQLTLTGSVTQPHFQLRSNLGQELSSGIQVAFAEQLETGRRELIARFNAETTQQSERLNQLYDQQISKLTGKLQLNRDEVMQLAQSAGLKLPGGVDLKQIANALPDSLRRPLDPDKPLDLKPFGNKLPKLGGKLPQLTTRSKQQDPPAPSEADLATPVLPAAPKSNSSPRPPPSDILPAGNDVEEPLQSLFGRKRKTTNLK